VKLKRLIKFLNTGVKCKKIKGRMTESKNTKKYPLFKFQYLVVWLFSFYIRKGGDEKWKEII